MSSFNFSRFKNRIKEEFELEVITPVFLRGVDNNVELRESSLKGLLRFWWRTLIGDKIQKIKDIKEQEDNIFGNTDKKSDLIIRIITNNNDYISDKNFSDKSYHILNYLAYGVFDTQTRKIAPYIKPETTLKVIIEVSKENLDDIKKAMFVLIKYGGLGAKSRNGFGSLRFKKGLNFNIESITGDLKSFTSFSNESKLYKFKNKKSWRKALEDLGEKYKESKMQLKDNNPLDDKRKYIDGKSGSRHAKPYFLHINQLTNGDFQGQILFLPYRYYYGPNNYNEQEFKKYLDACKILNSYIENNFKPEVINELP